VQWPTRLKTLQFGQSFDQQLESVSWPLSLEDLTFGGRFVRPSVLFVVQELAANNRDSRGGVCLGAHWQPLLACPKQ